MTGMSRSAAKRKRASAGAKLTDEQRRRALGESSCTFGGSRRGTVTTLLDFVASRFDYYTREQWVAQIQRGALRVNGEAATPEAPLPPGARIAMDMPRSNEPEVDLAYRIIHEFKQAASPPAATPPAKRSRLPDTAAAAQPTGDADADADGGGGKDARPGGDAAALPDPSPRPEPAASSGGQQQQQQQGQDRASTKGQEEEQEEQPFWFIAVEKSANLPVSPSGRYRKNTLSYELQYNVCLDAHPVHRIDKETSGCVIVAMNAATSAALSALFAGSDVTKEYTAVLVGELRSESAVDQPVLPKHSIAGEGYCTGDLHPMKRIRMACHPQGKPCRTTFTPLAVANGLTLVRVAIEQGRTHQIRVHAEWLGHPLLGDKVYGHGEGSEAQTLRWTRNEEPFETPFGVVGRQLLHCSRIRLPGGVREGVPPADVVSDPAPFFRAFPACEPLFAKAAGQAGEAAAQPTKREEE